MLSKLNFRILRIIDEKVLVNILNYQKYYSIHKFLGFPLKKLDFYYTHGYELDLKNPKTFNERIVYRQLFETNPLLATLVDKYAVREYVKEKIGEKYLIPLLQVADSYAEIDFTKLPDEYIMKMTHASGENVIVKQGINHLGYSDKKLREIFEKWFHEKYRYQSLIGFVQPIKRKILIEQLLKDESGKIPKDYKLFVFDGKVEFILVIHDRFDEYTENLYNRDWTPATFKFRDPTGELEERPSFLDDLIQTTEKLAADFTAMRVDMYVLGSKIYFGELTPAHANAQDVFYPIDYDEYYGSKWKNSTQLIKSEKN